MQIVDNNLVERWLLFDLLKFKRLDGFWISTTIEYNIFVSCKEDDIVGSINWEGFFLLNGPENWVGVDFHLRFLGQYVLVYHHEVLSGVHHQVINYFSQNQTFDITIIFVFLLDDTLIVITVVSCCINLIMNPQNQCSNNVPFAVLEEILYLVMGQIL